MFIDEIEIDVHAGDGGSGKVSFHREKYVQKGKPDGGNGGQGGNIIIESKEGYSSLDHLSSNTFFRAENGKSGGTNNKTGKNGNDCVIRVPPGTVIKDPGTGEVIFDFRTPDSSYIVKGGRGGLGNANFKSAINRSPRYAQPGERGVQRRIRLELKLIADAGLVGFPNAGKSTLLSKISDAHPTLADYPFTTLSPYLGVVCYKDFRFLAADIPGLIKNAHKGAGLGFSFLKHIERTKALVYILDASESGAYEKFLTLQDELKFYNPALLNRPSIVVLNKIDKKEAEKNIKLLRKKFKQDVLEISALLSKGIKPLIKEMAKKVGKK